jgi:hypothetical protein
MSRRTRETFKKVIGPRIARSKSVRRVRLLIIVPLLAGDTKEKARARIKKEIELHEPCPVKVRALTERDRVVSQERVYAEGDLK